jgi:hypothetical protein
LSWLLIIIDWNWNVLLAVHLNQIRKLKSGVIERNSIIQYFHSFINQNWHSFGFATW